MQPLESLPKQQIFFEGTEHKFTMPDGRVLTIRESNGEDDDMLSQLGAVLKGDHVNNFLANIITMDSLLKRRPTAEDILKWPNNNRLYALFKQRLINHGSALHFQHQCQNPNCKNYELEKVDRLEEDIAKFDGDLADKDYKPSHTYAIRKYGEGKSKLVEFETSSNKKFRFKILTGELQLKELEIDEGNISRNTKLLLRELEIYIKSEWQKLENFRSVSSKEMTQVRQAIIDNDPTFDPMVHFKCPTCKNPSQLSLFTIPNFYFPEDMISM